jgi:Sec-independent protein translocase protein TatA
MTIFGIGGFEVLLIGAIALFVLGPKRLLDGIRQGRRVYTDLKRQRDALQSLVTEAIDLEEIKKQVSVDEIKDSAASLENELALDQLNEDAQKSLSSSVSRKRKLTWSETSTEEERLDHRPESQPLLDEKTTSDSGDSESTS